MVLWRDSVAAGDDVDAPHEVVLKLGATATVGELCSQVSKVNYLPAIAGGRATWILQGTSPLAVLAQQWPSPRFIAARESFLSALARSEGKPQFELLYWCQADPELVHHNLCHDLPLPDKYRP